MPKCIVAPFRSLVVPDTEPNSSTLPIGYQSARRVGRKERNAAGSTKVVPVSAVKPVLQKILSSQIKCCFLDAKAEISPFLPCFERQQVKRSRLAGKYFSWLKNNTILRLRDMKTGNEPSYGMTPTN